VAPGIELDYQAEDVARGRDLRGKIADEGTLADIEAAAAALGTAKRGIVGYCWGGTVAWWGATRSRSFLAAVGWYGGGIVATRDATAHCPVELHFGETDASIPMADVQAIQAAQPDVGVFVYPGAGHGFGCEERASYSAKDAILAQQRTLAFFAKHLV
jgi:carboxymethylenebutenolidase